MRRKKQIVKLAKLAHLKEEGIKRGLEPLQYDFVNWFDAGGTQGYLAKCEEGQVLIFRESDSIIKEPIDWIRNFSAWTKEYEGKEYHYGYLKNYLDNFDKIMNKVEDINLVTAGFSLGGGMSEVVANVLSDTTGFNAWFANIDGAAVIKENGYTNGIWTANSNDPVPISTTLLGYKHFGGLVYFTFRGRTYINPKMMFRRIDFLIETGEDVFELSKGVIDFEHNLSEIDKFYDKGMKKIEKIL